MHVDFERVLRDIRKNKRYSLVIHFDLSFIFKSHLHFSLDFLRSFVIFVKIHHRTLQKIMSKTIKLFSLNASFKGGRDKHDVCDPNRTRNRRSVDFSETKETFQEIHEDNGNK